MSYSNGKITAPVSISDVKSALGASETGLGSLCTHSNINIWARYKPEKHAVIGSITDAQRASNSFGLSVYSTTNFANIISNTTGGMNGWTYTRPSGGVSSPYRLTDFNGYNHMAVPMVANLDGTRKTAAGKNFSASAMIPMSGGDNVALPDFSFVMYFGVAICQTNGTVVYKGTNSTANQAYVSFTMPASISLGTYRVYPFLCNNVIQASSGAFSGSNTFWTLPNLNYYELLVTTAAEMTDVKVDGQWFGKSHTKMTITVKSNSSTSYTGTIYVRRAGRSWSDVAYSDEKTSATLTITSQETIQVFTGFLSEYTYHAQLRLTGGELFEIPILDSLIIQ